MERTNQGNVTIVSKKVMAKIVSTPTKKYDAKKAAKEAKRTLKEKGLKL